MEVRNGFKGIDLIDIVHDELWMKVYDIVQETQIKTIPKKKKFQKAKWLKSHLSIPAESKRAEKMLEPADERS